MFLQVEIVFHAIAAIQCLCIVFRNFCFCYYLDNVDNIVNKFLKQHLQCLFFLTEMASNWQKIGLLLMLSDDLGFDTEDELLLACCLKELQPRKCNPLPDYRKYNQFSVTAYSDEEFVSQFHFQKDDVPILANRLGLPQNIVFTNGVTAECVEVMCLILHCLSYPNRLCDLISQFGRSE